jgi:hypothetical protein
MAAQNEAMPPPYLLPLIAPQALVTEGAAMTPI